MSNRDSNQGEGDRASARRYNTRTEKFAHSEAGRKAMEKGPELTSEEEKRAEAQERKGRSRAREKDPQVVRDYRKPEQ